jgi:murein L,D-transpeptidase YafK
MRNIFILIILCIFSCKQNAQNSNEQAIVSNKPEQGSFYEGQKSQKVKFDKVKIDTVADIAKGVNEKSVSFIKSRLQALVGNYLKEKCIANGISYPPKFIVFRCFKYEKEFEVWAGNSRSDSLRRILFTGICAIDNQPGTKLMMGDGKTPEGFYNTTLQYGSPNGFMWIKLNNSEIDDFGTPNYGSSFKIYLDYPNALDKQRTKTLLKNTNTGGAIYAHANCVTAGCISFINRDYLPIYLAALSHNSNEYGPIKMHVFPFRFDKISESDKTYYSENNLHMKKDQLIKTWNNLEEGYNLFNNTRKALKISIMNNSKYTFGVY